MFGGTGAVALYDDKEKERMEKLKKEEEERSRRREEWHKAMNLRQG